MAYLKEYTVLTPQEKRANYYKELYKKEHPNWDDSLVLLTKLFDTFVTQRKNLTVLDAGCGNGNWVIDETTRKISSAIGVDVDKSATLKNKCLDKIVIADLDNVPFKTNTFDAAISLWVAEHLEYPEKVFSEINRVLKKGGYFVFVTPDKGYVLILMRRLLNIFNSLLGNRIVTFLYGRTDPDIFPTFYKANTLKDLEEIAKKTGYKVEVLKKNFDPSYTSFNGLTFQITTILHLFLPSLFEPHIVGVFRKI